MEGFPQRLSCSCALTWGPAGSKLLLLLLLLSSVGWVAGGSRGPGGAGIELCLKGLDEFAPKKYEKHYTLTPRCLTFLKAQLGPPPK